MTKMRVHELAKELGMENKEILDILKKKNVEVKNHMSTLEDNVTEEIRREAKAEKAGGAEKVEKPAEAKDGAAPKKKNLAFVVRPQNSKNSSRLQGKRPSQSGARPARPAGEGRPARPERPAQGAARPERTERPAQRQEKADQPARREQRDRHSARREAHRALHRVRIGPREAPVLTEALRAETVRREKEEEHVRREATDLSVRTETTEDRARTAADAISSSADVTSAQADRDRAATGEATPAEMTGMRSALL